VLSVPEQKSIQRAMRTLHNVFGLQTATEGKTRRSVA
jgi:hypothetical protein